MDDIAPNEQEIDQAITDILASAAQKNWEVMVIRHHRKISINGLLLSENASQVCEQALNRMINELEWLYQDSDCRYLVSEKGREVHFIRSSQYKNNTEQNIDISKQDKGTGTNADQ